MHEGRLAQARETLDAISPDCTVSAKLCDVTNEEQVQALVAFAETEMSGVDVLINNAGLGGSKRLVDMTDEEWSRVLDITLTGTMRMTRAMLREMGLVAAASSSTTRLCLAGARKKSNVTTRRRKRALWR